MIEPILILLLSLCFTFYSALIDSEHLANGQYFTDHRPRWLLRLIFFIALGCVDLIYFPAAALIFTALFDQVLNHLRVLPFWYLGTEAKWDIFFEKRMILYKIIKITSLVVGVYLIFKK